jgi:hypothetical protein
MDSESLAGADRGRNGGLFVLIEVFAAVLRRTLLAGYSNGKWSECRSAEPNTARLSGDSLVVYAPRL